MTFKIPTIFRLFPTIFRLVGIGRNRSGALMGDTIFNYIIKKEENGKVNLKENTYSGFGGTLGSLAGLNTDTINSMSTNELLEKVSADLSNGKVMVVAHIFEQ